MEVGVVARNEGGNFVASLTASLPHVWDPLIADILTAWRAVDLGRELGYQRIVLEGDSMIIVKALNQD
jgi:hypothetical protein